MERGTWCWYVNFFHFHSTLSQTHSTMIPRRPERQPRYFNKLWPIEEIPSTCTNLLSTHTCFKDFLLLFLMTSNIFIGATGWENSGGGGASSWNDNAGGVATDDDNFGETGRDNFNDSNGGDAHSGVGAAGGSCRRCGQGKLSSYIIGAWV